MITKKEWAGFGTATVAILLLLSGYVITEDTYYCKSTGDICEGKYGISGGKNTRCYETIEQKASWWTGYKCNEGWVSLKEYQDNVKVYFGNTTKKITMVVEGVNQTKEIVVYENNEYQQDEKNLS